MFNVVIPDASGTVLLVTRELLLLIKNGRFEGPVIPLLVTHITVRCLIAV